MERLCPQPPGKWEHMKHGTALSFCEGVSCCVPALQPFAENVHLTHMQALALTVDCKLAFCWHWEEVQVKGFQGKFEFSYEWERWVHRDTQPAALVRVLAALLPGRADSESGGLRSLCYRREL